MFINKDEIQIIKEKLGDKNAELIAHILKIKKWDARGKRGLCPFHEETTPSFVYNPKRFNFKCFGCGRNVDLVDAYMAVGLTRPEAFKKILDDGGNINDAEFFKPVYKKAGAKTAVINREYRYPKLNISLRENSPVYEYLGRRGISKGTVDAAGIREDAKGNIAFNYFDYNNVLRMVKYRRSRKLKPDEKKSWCQKNADTTPLLFNMNRIDTSAPLIICEGEIDCLAAIEAGYSNAVSVPFGAGNFSWIEECSDWLNQFKKIIIIADNDEAGAKMQSECLSAFGSLRTRIVDIPRSFVKADGKQVSMKDLNHCLYYGGKAYVKHIIMQSNGISAIKT